MNGDGYIDYEKRSRKGLVNQGWKDSWDSIVHRDGSLAAAPITLVEVQAYAYAALHRLAPVFEALGDDREAAGLRVEAAALRERFARDFWMEDEGCYALALDGTGAQVGSVTSNPGHVLWAGAATTEHAQRVGRRLMEPDMFSGWGVRTLTLKSPRYNPQGYHLGTIWPHDNSILAMGLKRYGLVPELTVLATALFEAAREFQYYRLPELFDGSQTTPHQTPVPYPVACRPQAWAAGAIPLVTQAMLGLCPDAPNKRLYVVAPSLPNFLDEAQVRLQVGSAKVDLAYIRRGQDTYVVVKEVRGEVEVREARDWPEHL